MGLEGAVATQFADDVTQCFGNGDTLCTVWDTTDPNANLFKIEVPTGGAIDVPVVVVGQGIIGVDLGLFNGLTQPQFAVLDSDRDSAIMFGFSADDQGQIVMLGAATTLRIYVIAGQNIEIGDGSPILHINGTDVVRIRGAGSGNAPLTFVVGGSSTANGSGARLAFIANTTGSTQSAGFEGVRTNSPMSGDGTVLCYVLQAGGERDIWTAGDHMIIHVELEIDGALNHDGSTAGFYGTVPTTLQTGVAVTAAGVHAALVTLGLITA